jgi:hypothetical protein
MIFGLWALGNGLAAVSDSVAAVCYGSRPRMTAIVWGFMIAALLAIPAAWGMHCAHGVTNFLLGVTCFSKNWYFW